MLSAGAAASITMYRLRYDLEDMLAILLLILVLFYIAGIFVMKMLNRFERQNEEAERVKEGEVIEKEADEENSQESAADQK